MYPDLIKYADGMGWWFRYADQDALQGFLQLHRFSMLPNTYNYKPYWGPVEQGPLWGPHGEIVIMHTHGPKIEQVLCIQGYLQQAESCFSFNDNIAWKDMWSHYQKSCPQVRPCRSPMPSAAAACNQMHLPGRHEACATTSIYSTFDLSSEPCLAGHGSNDGCLQLATEQPGCAMLRDRCYQLVERQGIHVQVHETVKRVAAPERAAVVQAPAAGKRDHVMSRIV